MLLVCLTIAMALVSFVLWRTVRYRRVESVVARYESEPSQAAVDELCQVLKEHAATRGQGTRILRLLLWPEVTTQPAYCVGKPVHATLKSIYWGSFAHLSARQDVQCEDGRVVDNRNRRISLWSTVPDTLFVPSSPQEPGACRAVIHYDLTATYETAGASTWKRLFSSIFPRALWRWTCTWRFDVPVEVNVVATEQAE